MTKNSLVLIFLFVFGWSCAKKIAPDTSAEKQNKTEKTKQSEHTKQETAAQKTEEATEDPDKEKGKPPVSEPANNPLPPALPPPNMPKGPEKASEADMGKAIYTSQCKKCHAPKNVRNYTFAQWESILKTMVPNAKLSAEEEGFLLAYIRANAK